jgi:hypothetical protein
VVRGLCTQIYIWRFGVWPPPMRALARVESSSCANDSPRNSDPSNFRTFCHLCFFSSTFRRLEAPCCWRWNVGKFPLDYTVSHLRLCTFMVVRTSVSLCNVFVWEVTSGFLSIIHTGFVLKSGNALRWVLIMRSGLISWYILDYDICFQLVCLGHLYK